MQDKNNRVERLLSRLKGRLQVKFKAGLRDERGAAAVFFAVGLVLLAPAALGLVDVYLTTTQRAELQDALDTATLYAARSDKMTDAELKTVGEAALLSNLKLPDGQKFVSSDFKLAADKITVVGTAQIEAPAVGPKLWDRADLTANSEVLRNSNNVEVALVLDTTGSMQNNMANLRSAANDLVTLVIKEQQKPYYTKVALVPYSVGVNMGSLADTVRGPAIGPKVISAATQTNPIQITTTAEHGLQDNERVLITGVAGMTALNDTEFVVTRVDATKFKLNNIDGTKTNTYKKYTSGGAAQCLREGCAQQSFQDTQSVQRRMPVSTCATERVGAYAFEGAGPGTAKVGWHYNRIGASDGSCQSATVVPLTSTKKTLTDQIALLKDDGSTAGHIGLAWGWYMISPDWDTVWTGDSAPAAYQKPQTLKVVVLMTDGAFNTAYCKGVNAQNSGFGEAKDRIKCNATNGTAFAQADTLCKNIKAKGVFIYTVGFNVGNDANVKKLMNDCATSAEYVYMPANGTQLKVAFRAIAQDINSLRISK